MNIARYVLIDWDQWQCARILTAYAEGYPVLPDTLSKTRGETTVFAIPFYEN